MAEWSIRFIDMDVCIEAGLVSWMRVHLDPGRFDRASLHDGVRYHETWGPAICHRMAFAPVGGYDEMFRGLGGENDDLYRRLAMMGIYHSEYPSRFISPIRHEDTERFAFREVKYKAPIQLTNQPYREAEHLLMSLQGISGDPPLKIRMPSMGQIRARVMLWNDQPSTSLPSIRPHSDGPGDWLSEPYLTRAGRNIQLSIDTSVKAAGLSMQERTSSTSYRPVLWRHAPLLAIDESWSEGIPGDLPFTPERA